MSWNGSGSANTASESGGNRNKPRASRSGLRYKGVLAVLVVVIGGAVVLWLVSGHDKTANTVEAPAKRSLIHAVDPAITHKPDAVPAVPVVSAVTNQPKRRWPGVKSCEGNTGYSKIDYGRIETNVIDKAHKSIEDRIFENTVDRKIARLLMIEPGTEIVAFADAESIYRNFDEKFLRSIKTPIIISDNDTEEEKALKRAVRETKIELKARLDAGENLEQVMTDTRRQLQEIGLYREELKKEIEKVAHKKELTDSELQDYVDAANKMLEARGSKPITMPSFIRRRIEIKNSTTQDNKEIRKSSK